MAKRYRTSIDITVDLDEFDNEAIKAYCLENNIFSKAAYEEVFDKVLGCGLEELKKIE